MADSEFKKYVERVARAPIFLVAKYQEPYDDLNPSVKIIVRPAGGLTPESLNAALDKVIGITVPKLGAEPSKSPSKGTEISGYPAAYAEFDYTLKTGSGLEFPITSQMWWILKGDLLFMVGTGMNQDESTDVRAEIQSVIDSLKLD